MKYIFLESSDRINYGSSVTSLDLSRRDCNQIFTTLLPYPRVQIAIQLSWSDNNY